MTASNLWGQFIQPIETGELEELRRGTIFEIGAVVFVIAWVVMVGAYGKPEQLLVAFILMGCSVISIGLRGLNFRMALVWLIATLIAAIACQKWLFPQSAAQYYFPVVVVVSSLLVSGPNVFFVAALAGGTLLAVAQLQGANWLDPQQVINPMILTMLIAAAAWIGSRQIRLALEWMQRNYKRTSELLEQLRDERASLARTLKMLEDAYVRIEKMNYALIEARSAAENARQLKGEFAANISHELRTPLNLIIGFSETMANAPETYQNVVWSPDLRGDIEQIYHSSRHLSSLIEDILDLSALDARRLGFTLQDTTIDTVIAEATGVMQDLFRAKELYLKVELAAGLPRLRIDPTRIRQVLINLLTNANRFTRTGGVTIKVELIDKAVRVLVKDTGIGIAAGDIPKVFEEFGQVDGSTTRKHEGTGLGVPLSKRLIESHGGQMWLESHLGAGTTFYFTLPLSPQATQGMVTTQSGTWADAPTYHRAVLVLETDPLLLRTLRRHLSDYDVIQIGSSDDVAALVEQYRPVALVVNVQEADSVAWRVPSDLPVIHMALTGNLHAAQSLGVQNYLIKPILREQLVDAIARLGTHVRDVLIVDDDPELVELIARMLQSVGSYHPIKTFGGADALARLRSEKVDLVILDLFMPGVDGMGVLQEMKRDPELAEIPVIIVSAQQPEIAETERGLFVRLERAERGSITETLNCLQALIETLPLRGLPTIAHAPA